LRHTVDHDIRQRLVSALILSWIDYYNALLAGLPAVTLAQMRRVTNAARFMAGLGPRDHTSNAVRQFHWLLIEHQLQTMRYDA
jgi:hypothetical protein